MEEPTISVIIPVYNVEAYLKKCVDSVLAQTYRSIEVILVDDGSPDRCGAMCDDYARENPHVRVIHKKNGGLSAARNAGLDAASGQYIAFVDSDDYVAPEMLERLREAAVKTQAELVICDCCMVNETGEEEVLPPLSAGVYTPRQAVEAMEADPFYWRHVTAWNRLYKKELFDTIRFPVGRLHEDEFTVLSFYERCKRIVVIPDRLYYYLQRDGSIMTDRFLGYSYDGLDAYLEQIHYYQRRGWTDLAGGPVLRAYKRCWVCLRSIDVWQHRKTIGAYVKTVSRALCRCDLLRSVYIRVYYALRLLQCRFGRKTGSANPVHR